MAFENPRKIQTQKRESQNKKAAKDKDADNTTYNYLVPDRIGGIEELHELEKLCPRRKWNFVSQILYSHFCTQLTGSLRSKSMLHSRYSASMS